MPTRTLVPFRRASCSWLAAVMLATACTSDDPADDAALDTGTSEGTTASAETDAPASDASTSPGSTSAPDPADSSSEDSSGEDTGPAELGAIAGSITRTAEPTGGGVGSVYVAIFADNPITTMDAAALGQAVLEDSDLGDPATTLAYVIEGIPARTEAYHVVAFLDDDGNADTMAPGPDMGDLVTLDGTGTPTVVITPGDPVPMDLVLNAVMPF